MHALRVAFCTLAVVACCANAQTPAPAPPAPPALGYDFQYTVSQVGIDTTLANANNSQLFEQQLQAAWLTYAPAIATGSPREGDWWPEWDFMSKAAQRTLSVHNSAVLIGGPGTVTGSKGSFTFTGALQMQAPGQFSLQDHYDCSWWSCDWETDCNSPGTLSVNVPLFSYKVDFVETATVGVYTLTSTCEDLNLAASDVSFPFCDAQVEAAAPQYVIPAIQTFVCDTLQSAIVPSLQSWIAPGRVVQLDGTAISAAFTITDLQFQSGLSVQMQSSVDFHVKQPHSLPDVVFNSHRATELPSANQQWPAIPYANSTTSVVSVSREFLTNIFSAANSAGYLKYNGTFDVENTRLFVNGSMDDVKVVFPSSGTNAHLSIHTDRMHVSIHCDEYTGFNVLDVDLHSVVTTGLVMCDSWNAGLSLGFANMQIGNASVSGMSTDLQLPPALIKPLVQESVSFAMPMINDHLKSLAFHFPDSVQWLAPLAPNPNTVTTGVTNTELEGYVSIVFYCECGSGVAANMLCAGQFCNRGCLENGDCDAESDSVSTMLPTASGYGTSNPSFAMIDNDADSCFVIASYPNEHCEVPLGGENVTVARLCIKSDSPNTTCLNMSSPLATPISNLFGEIASVQSTASNMSKMLLGVSCMWGVDPKAPAPAPGEHSHQTCYSCREQHESSNVCIGGIMVSPTLANGSLACGEGYQVTFNNESVALNLRLIGASPIAQPNGSPHSSSVVGLEGDPHPSHAKAISPVFSVMSILPLPSAGDATCVPCAQGELGNAMVAGHNELYCQVMSANSAFAVVNLFCTSSSCAPGSCLQESETLSVGFPGPTITLTDGSLLEYKVVSPEVAGVCEVIPIKIFGILLGWAIVIVIAAAALIAGTVYVVSKHGDQVAVLFQNFRISALFFTIALYAVAGIAIYYAWTFDNPALLQSNELVAKLSYATTNNSNSSYAVNLSGIDPQMHRFVAAGLILVLVLLGVSFVLVALSTLHWDACRMVRVLGLIPLLFVPMAGFSAFMAQSNWLSVVYMGQTNSSAGDSIGAMLSATWLETIVISTMDAISTTLLVIPLGVVGGMVILDEWESVGGALPAAQWTACVASVVTIQLLSAMLSLLIKMLLLVTGFEANGTEMFESFALLTCAPTAGLVLMGIDRAIRAGCTNRCCSFLRHVVRFVVGLGLMLGSVYYLVFLFGGISTYTLSHLDTAWWDLTCVLLSMTASFYIAIELMRLATGYKANAKQTPSRNEQDQALADVVQAGLESEHEEKQENRAVITLTWALQAVDEEDEREAEAKARKPVDLRPQHVVERQGSDSTSSRRCLAAFRGCGLFWVELGLWILERQQYRDSTKGKIMFRRVSALVAAVPLYFYAASTYPYPCVPYGYPSVYEMTDTQLFNCSLDQLTDELSQYADTTVHIDPRPGAAFYDIVQLRKENIKEGALLGMAGVTLFFYMAVAGVLEGLEIPIRRLYQSRFLQAIVGRELPAYPRGLGKFLGIVSHVLLAISRLLGIAALGVVCLATFKPYTVAYDQLLNITCCCMGDFCTMVEDSLTSIFQNLQLSSLAMEIFVLSVSVPWTLGRIAYFLLQDSLDVKTRKYERNLGRTLSTVPEGDQTDGSNGGETVARSPGGSGAQEEEADDNDNLVPVVWVMFFCTTVFMVFTATMLGVIGSIAGVSPSVWGLAVFLLGGLVPLFIVLLDVTSCTQQTQNSRLPISLGQRTKRLMFAIGGIFLAAAVPTVLFAALQMRVGNQSLGVWEYLAIVTVVAFGVALVATVLVPAACSKKKPKHSIFVPRQPSAQFNLNANFFSVVSLCGAAIYCVTCKWSVTEEWYAMVVVCIFALIMVFCLLMAACHRLPRAVNFSFSDHSNLNRICRDAEMYIQEGLDTKDDENSDSDTVAHTENVTVCVAPHSKEGGHNRLQTRLVATVRVRKTGGALVFQTSILASFVQRWLEQKTLLLYIAWGDAWFLFAMLFVVSNMLVSADESFALSEFNVSTVHPSFDLLAYLWHQLFAAGAWPRTLAQFFGADVVLTDIIFFSMTISKLCACRNVIVKNRVANDELIEPLMPNDAHEQLNIARMENDVTPHPTQQPQTTATFQPQHGQPVQQREAIEPQIQRRPELPSQPDARNAQVEETQSVAELDLDGEDF